MTMSALQVGLKNKAKHAVLSEYDFKWTVSYCSMIRTSSSVDIVISLQTGHYGGVTEFMNGVQRKCPELTGVPYNVTFLVSSCALISR